MSATPVMRTESTPSSSPTVRARRWPSAAARLIHLHLHDFLETDHIAPMDGNLQWAEVFGALKDIDYQGVFMFEALFPPERRENRPEYVLGKTAEFPQAFAARYG